MVDWQTLASRVQTSAQRVFGESATYFPPDGVEPYAIRGIFDAAHVRVEVVDGVEVETTAPVLSVHLADFTSPPEHRARVSIREGLYDIIGLEPDGQGDSGLVLEKVA